MPNNNPKFYYAITCDHHSGGYSLATALLFPTLEEARAYVITLINEEYDGTDVEVETTYEEQEGWKETPGAVQSIQTDAGDFWEIYRVRPRTAGEEL